MKETIIPEKVKVKRTTLETIISEWIEVDSAYMCCRFCNRGITQYENADIYEAIYELRDKLKINEFEHEENCPAFEIYNLLNNAKTE